MMSIKREFYSLGATENDITARPLCIGLMFEQQHSARCSSSIQRNTTAIQFIRARERLKRKVVEGGFGAEHIIGVQHSPVVKSSAVQRAGSLRQWV